MATEKHLRIINEGVMAWNRWREDKPTARPNLSGADLSGLNLSGANFSKTDFSEADLSGVQMTETDLIRTKFPGANLSGADLSMADLLGANFSEAKLGEADLSEANLSGANLDAADLVQADLNGANLQGATLSWTNLFETDFRNANLKQADLTGATLIGTHLSEADLSEANLYKAILSGAYLNGLNLTNASVGFTTFSDINLSSVEGLETVHHDGPSTIGIDTIYRSAGKIPESFLRGAGVPDDIIRATTILKYKDVHYYSCFISYSSKDKVFAKRLHADLRKEGVRCWFAPEEMRIGDEILPTIYKSIHSHDKLLLILSENSLSSSWVENEVERSFTEEREREQTVLFPVRLDDSVMETNEAWAKRIRKRHIGDFTEWRDRDAYQTAFERLLRDLQTREDAPPPNPFKDNRIRSLKTQLTKYYEILNDLEVEAAEYGTLGIPTRLRNEIKSTKRKIDEIKQELDELDA